MLGIGFKKIFPYSPSPIVREDCWRRIHSEVVHFLGILNCILMTFKYEEVGFKGDDGIRGLTFLIKVYDKQNTMVLDR